MAERTQTSTSKSTARSTSQANAEEVERAPIASKATDGAYVEAWNAWNGAPPATRGAAPTRPIGRSTEALLYDIAVSLRKLTGDDKSEADHVKAYEDQQAGFEKLSEKVDATRTKAQQAIADAEAELAAAKAKADEDVAKAKGEKLSTDA